MQDGAVSAVENQLLFPVVFQLVSSGITQQTIPRFEGSSVVSLGVTLGWRGRRSEKSDHLPPAFADTVSCTAFLSQAAGVCRDSGCVMMVLFAGSMRDLVASSLQWVHFAISNGAGGCNMELFPPFKNNSLSLSFSCCTAQAAGWVFSKASKFSALLLFLHRVSGAVPTAVIVWPRLE
jgi:hypothetical protein